MDVKTVLASDIDNTLTGDRKELKTLSRELGRMRESDELFLILSTGRRLEQVIDGFESEGIPQPDAIVSQVGTEIYLPPFHRDQDPLHVWRDMLMEDFSRSEALKLLEGLEGVRMQPDHFNTDLKVSCYLDEVQNPEAMVREIKRRAEYEGDGLCQVVWSSGRDLDIIPAAAGKGQAIRFILNLLKLDVEQIIVAGDSGNDRSMFEEFMRGIIVANAKPELQQFKKEHPLPDIYMASAPYAAGVREGLEYFELLGG